MSRSVLINLKLSNSYLASLKASDRVLYPTAFNASSIPFKFVVASATSVLAVCKDFEFKS